MHLVKCIPNLLKIQIIISKSLFKNFCIFINIQMTSRAQSNIVDLKKPVIMSS
jgi:hypothetical protein